MNCERTIHENTSPAIYKDRDELNKKMEKLIIEFNKKWMHVAYISCESPFCSNEYPLKVKLNSISCEEKE